MAHRREGTDTARWRMWAWVAIPALGLTGCGTDGTPAEPDDRRPAAVAALSTAEQVGTVGESVPEPISVQVTTEDGDAVEGASVTFDIVDGDGSISATERLTDADGIASVDWTLGTRAGSNEVSVAVGELTPVVFRATGEPGSPVGLEVLVAPTTVRAGEAFPLVPVVAIVDQYGNPTGSGGEIRATLEGEGEITGSTAPVGEDGRASFSELSVEASVGLHSLTFEDGELGATEPRSFFLMPPARSTQDRPDELVGSQVHVVYAVAADGPDRGLDVETEIAYSIASLQRWFTEQTAHRIRFDEFAGVTDVTFVQLPDSVGEMAELPSLQVLERIEDGLSGAGLSDPDKLYLVYYDGPGGACGSTRRPPLGPGRTAALHLNGDADACSGNWIWPAPDEGPTYREALLLHFAIHLFGLVSPDAPGAISGGHVSEPDDLMYGGSPWRWYQMEIDIGHDDYFGSGVPAGIPSIEASPYVEPAPIPTLTAHAPTAIGLPSLQAPRPGPPPHGETPTAP